MRRKHKIWYKIQRNSPVFGMKIKYRAVEIYSFSEASDTVRLSHSGGGCKYADAPDVYEIPQPVQERLQII